MATTLVSTPTYVQTIDRVRYYAWEVEEASASSGDAIVVSGVPIFFTLVLFEGTVASGTIQPTITVSVDSSATFAGLSEVVSLSEADSYVRVQCDVRVTCPSGVLRIENAPSGSGVNIKTRLTIREGF